MKHSLILAALCLALPLHTTTQENDVEIQLSTIELEEIFQNPDRSYVCLSKEISYLPHVIEAICRLDPNQESPVHALKKHMELGYVIGREDAIVDVLKYAELVLYDNQSAERDEQLQEITKIFDMVFQQVMQGSLSLDAEKLAFLRDSSAQGTIITEDTSAK